MRKKISNERLDEIGSQLISAGKLTRDDIDRIAGKTDLFNAVRRRIDVERTSREGTPAGITWSVGWTAAFAGAGSVFIAALWFSLAPVSTYVGQAKTPVSFVPQVVAVDDPPPITAATALDPPVRRVQQAARAMAAAAAAKPQRRTVKREEFSDFYALATAGEDNDDDLRMIRVELPRTTLVAMGLNMHLENETEKVKTDLLIGNDGVPRAVRLVK